MSRWELACNWLLGLSALGWAVKALAATEADSRWTAVPLTLCAINALVGVLFLVRAPLNLASRPWLLVAALPSFLLGGLVMRLSPGHPWPYYAQGLFAAGGAFTFASLVWLGRSFALLPGVRQVVVRGPYRLVRHPAYAGECLMLFAICLAGPTYTSILVALAAVGFLVVRILAEETTLLAEPDYQEYARTHRWRLLPGVW